MKQSNRTVRRMPVAAAARWLAPLSWMAVIFFLSSREGDELDRMLPLFRRLLPGMTGFDWGHFAAYFILALLLEYALGPRSFGWRAKALVVLLCVAYGVTDEYHQSFVDGRMPDAADVRNDGIGAAAAVLLTAVPPVRRLWRRLIGMKSPDR